MKRACVKWWSVALQRDAELEERNIAMTETKRTIDGYVTMTSADLHALIEETARRVADETTKA